MTSLQELYKTYIYIVCMGNSGVSGNLDFGEFVLPARHGDVQTSNMTAFIRT